MRKKMAQRRPWFLWIGGACVLVGSLVAGSISLASSAAPGPTVQGTVTANQGTPGSSSWPVSASQSGTWQQEITDGTNVLGTSDHPVRTDPTGTTTQPVSGNVGITDGTNMLGTSDHPVRTDPTGTTTQPVSGNVGISGSLPAGTNDIGTVQVAAPTTTDATVFCDILSGSVNICPETDFVPALTAPSVVNTVSAFCDVKTGSHVQVLFNAGSGFITIYVPLSFQGGAGVTGTADAYVGTVSNLSVPITDLSSTSVGIQEDYTTSGTDGAGCDVTMIGTSS
jgi:hypothetical protein